MHHSCGLRAPFQAAYSQRLLLKAALLASDATNNEETGASIGDPTEVALVMLGEKFGVD